MSCYKSGPLTEEQLERIRVLKEALEEAKRSPSKKLSDVLREIRLLEEKANV
jgi:hypothetical protein